ncbi:HepT-like ribonuclease domain-containing protein [Tundrisphaera lichenicola]|uniref:HepT-like ribonuclease domain-containing protein n=1 Tax=Tundrisphaera lichenicola TaxID=2029860 RepID=UPI003EB736DB
MSRHDDLTYLKHMRDYAAEAVSFTRDRRRADLDTDRMLMLAVCRLLEMMGESACQLPASFRERETEIPWKQIIGVRHRLVHAYDQVDLDIIWNIAIGDLPPLIAALDRVLSEMGKRLPGTIE